MREAFCHIVTLINNNRTTEFLRVKASKTMTPVMRVKEPLTWNTQQQLTPSNKDRKVYWDIPTKPTFYVLTNKISFALAWTAQHIFYENRNKLNINSLLHRYMKDVWHEATTNKL